MIAPRARQQMNPQAAKVYNNPMIGQPPNKPMGTPSPRGFQKPSRPAAPKGIRKPVGKASPKTFQRPIPGQSLTAEPKNRPYERPPEITDPEDALRLHLTRLNDVERLDTAMLLLQKGVDVRTLTEGILRSAVTEGIHSIDVSLIIAPTIHDFIADVADEVGVTYKTGFEPDEKDKDRKEIALVKSMIGKGKRSKPAMKEVLREEPKQQMEMDLGEPKAAPKGLMART